MIGYEIIHYGDHYVVGACWIPISLSRLIVMFIATGILTGLVVYPATRCHPAIPIQNDQ